MPAPPLALEEDRTNTPSRMAPRKFRRISASPLLAK